MTKHRTKENKDSYAWDSLSHVYHSKPKRNERLIGQQIGMWELQALLGEGGMSSIFKGKHIYTKQIAAIKLLLPALYEDEGSARRFQREGKLLASLEHPNIVRIQEFGCDPEHGYFMVLELLQGRDLDKVIEKQNGPLPLSWMLGITKQICDALHYMHKRGIVHRDLKPSNIFLLPGSPFPTVKLLDFGIAKVQFNQNDTKLTATGSVIGTPAYLAPEQLIKTNELTAAIDLYALGVIWFEALTNQHPLGKGSHVELFIKIVQEIPKPLGTLRPELHETALEALVQSLLAKSPGDRPPTIRQCWDAFQHACSQLELSDDLENYPAIDTDTPIHTTQHYKEISQIHFSTDEAQLKSWDADTHDALDGGNPGSHSALHPHTSQSKDDSPKGTNKLVIGGFFVFLLMILTVLGIQKYNVNLTPNRKLGSSPQRTPSPKRNILFSKEKELFNKATQAFKSKTFKEAKTHLEKLTKRPNWKKSPYFPKTYQKLHQVHAKLGHDFATLFYASQYISADQLLRKYLKKRKESAPNEPKALKQHQKDIKTLEDRLVRKATLQKLKAYRTNAQKSWAKKQTKLTNLQGQLKKHLQSGMWVLAHLKYKLILQKQGDHPEFQLKTFDIVLSYFPELLGASRYIGPEHLLNPSQKEQLKSLNKKRMDLLAKRQEQWLNISGQYQKSTRTAYTRKALRAFSNALKHSNLLRNHSIQKKLEKWSIQSLFQQPKANIALWKEWSKLQGQLQENGIWLWLTEQGKTLRSTTALKEQLPAIFALSKAIQLQNAIKKAFDKGRLHRKKRLIQSFRSTWNSFLQLDRWNTKKQLKAWKAGVDSFLQKSTYIVILQNKLNKTYLLAKFDKIDLQCKELLLVLKGTTARQQFQKRCNTMQKRHKFAQKLLSKGEKAYRTKQWKIAKKWFKQFLKMFPSTHQAKAIKKKIRGCTCVLGAPYWKPCAKKEYPKHYRKRR